MRKSRGQTLILFAVFIAVAVVAVLTLVALSTLYGAREHARQSLQVATSAGARRVAYDGLGSGRPLLDRQAAVETTRAAFEQALALEDFGLGASPQEIAAAAEIQAENDVPWTSPYSGLTHHVPTVAARAFIPVRIFFFNVKIPVSAETEVNEP